MDGFDRQQAQDFAAAFRTFLEWVHSVPPDPSQRNEVVALVRDYLGVGGIERSVVSRQLPTFEHVNLQTALNAWMAEPGRRVTVHGVVTPPHYAGVTLQQLIAGEGMPPLRLAAPPLVDLPNGPGSTLACLLLAVLEVEDARGRYLVMVAGPTEHEPRLAVEVAGLEVAEAQEAHAELDVLRRRLNVYRGHVLDVTATHTGVSLQFAEVPDTRREDVVLPEQVLDRIERHTLGVSHHREALQALGQHIKRGLLLYGPPGTGKTHTTRYLVGRMDGYTRLTLTGRALQAVGSVAELARDLQPAVLVLEDVDLVAEDRSFGPGSNPVLFDLLDAMDGAAVDADLLFLLTTNRADLLEPALAARPGRVDVAVQIDLPDSDARRRLFDLYATHVTIEMTDAERSEVIERTDGVTASFLKELLRRAVLESLDENAPASAGATREATAGMAAMTTVTAAHCARALDDLLDSAQGVTRSLLGVGTDPSELPSGGSRGGGPRPMPSGMRARGRAGFGWTTYTPLG